MSGKRRIAVGSLFVECNHFGGPRTDKASFERDELSHGEAILDKTDGVVGGMLHVLSQREMEVIPLLIASACPGGPVTAECYRQLKAELLERLINAGPVDGVLLGLHGAGTVDDVGDLEGDLLSAVREQMGPDIPVMATLDLHAHITPAMVTHANALVAWETYPHRDSYTTGERAAVLLDQTLAGRIRPTMAMAKVPVITSAIHGNTEGEGPFADLMREAKSLEKQEGILSTSVFLVHPNLDLPGMGSGGLVLTDGNLDRAVTEARRIAEQYWERRFDLDPRVYSPAEAITQGLSMEEGPVLLVEAADCAGGGAAGDGVATLRALVEARVTRPSLAPVVDPEAAQECHRVGVGGEVTVPLGHHVDPQWGEPLNVTGQVVKLSEGNFRYTGGIWAGQEGRMGLSSVLQMGAIQVLVTTHATYDWADEQFRSLGLEPSQAHFVVVKNPMNYRLGYAGIAKAIFILDTPGPTPPVMHHLEFRNVERPYYPRDREIPGLEPTVFCGPGF